MTFATPTPELLADPVWRLTSGFYTIRSEQGKPIPFIPFDEQRQVIDAIYVHGEREIITPKPRQVHLSTVIAIIITDSILFGTSVQCTLLDLTAPAAKKKLEQMVIYAFDHLPDAIQNMYETQRALRDGIFRVKHKHSPDPNASSVFYAGDQARGGTNQILWMSEWAEIAADDPSRSSEYLRGAWPSAEQGIRIIETTWWGGQKGDVWNIAKKGLGADGNPLPKHLRSPGSPCVLFFPWWKMKKYRMAGSESFLRPETWDYLKTVETECQMAFEVDQALWYQDKWDTYGDSIKSIYPSTIHECWSSQIKGAIWAHAIARLKEEGRYTNVPHLPELEVDTFWDLGAQDNTRTTYVQHQAGARRIIDHDRELNLDLKERITHLKDKGYRFGTHYLPHDGAARQKNGISYQKEFEAELQRQGVGGRVVIIKMTPNKWLGINKTTEMLKKDVWLDQAKCKALTEDLLAYRRKEDKSNPGTFTDSVVEGPETHSADSVRYIFEALLLDHLPYTSNGIMTNLYFDAPTIHALSSKLPEHPHKLWTIESVGNEDFRRITARRDDATGWLRTWEDPVIGQSYIVSLTQGAVVVWRASAWDGMKERPACLVAACVDESGIHVHNLYAWAAMAASHYGDCGVLVDITSLPGAPEELRKRGVMPLARKQPISDRRIGQQSPEIRKPGHDFGIQERLEAYSVMQSMFRDQQAQIHCPKTLSQMQGIIIGEDGTPDLLTGSKEEWVKASALALWQIGLASLNMPRRSSVPEPSDFRGEQGRRPGRKMA